jgi:hypothetical protein
MDFENNEIVRLIIAITAGFAIGFGTLMVQYWDRGFSKQDMVEAYDTGYNEALKTNPASDRLEIVCAALWFAGPFKDD